ncbi:3-deoxy-manno-octulosonate cytidylyltransferase [Frankliniella fusca]|uniref:3-deoxy-manno-octulosonate cytidylyltransferase n=1 Tax=Frankliniella fusca TaxID=407009 RepID=A0AAE1HM42_9NEOP|nr:3-deoxy-manno-octulosonate cytidylyltransferase [Frankliniella fusca]KAK3923852.1 3-deoxy-manno-octulosonate cytidylyltransferase [Frankliniella fusca]
MPELCAAIVLIVIDKHYCSLHFTLSLVELHSGDDGISLSNKLGYVFERTMDYLAPKCEIYRCELWRLNPLQALGHLGGPSVLLY